MPFYICYVHPVDGLPRARPVTSYHEAGEVIATLEAMHADPKLEFDMDTCRQSALPVVVSGWDANGVHNLLVHGMREEAMNRIM